MMGPVRLSVRVLCLSLAITMHSASAVRWKCIKGDCVKLRDAGDSSDPPLSLEACKMFCNEYGLLWPRPTGEVDLGNYLAKISLEKISLQIANPGKSDELTREAFARFKKMVYIAVPEDTTPRTTGKSVLVNVINENPDIKEFSLTMDESYKLLVSMATNDSVKATITGKSFFGVRHGLETLAQLFVYDDHTEHVLLVRDATIEDKPVYPYRGFLLDTSRNYYSIDSIKATIDAMAAVKMNTFHWHITDTHSFPFVSERRPELSKIGAYAPNKVYTKQAIRELVHFARVRGVRVVPEFDAPAHVGEGWQHSNLTVCFGAQPWRQYCVEPPCGQLNPIREELYEYLEDIYTDMADAFDTDIFHMGGDEVSEACWKTSAEIKNFMVQNRWDMDEDGFLDLWNYFQTKAQRKAYKAFGKKLPLILWTSTLTNYTTIDRYLDKENYFIQVWTTGKDPQIHGLLKKGYNLIMSNYDALYLDCGFGSWVGTGNNWCSPYTGWQKVYDNSPLNMSSERYKKQILGGEAALWSEQADSATLDDRVWPRTAALAERLWAEPDTIWKDAERRMLHMRERLVRMGIKAESLQPLWCYQNEGQCDNILAPDYLSAFMNLLNVRLFHDDFYSQKENGLEINFSQILK